MIYKLKFTYDGFDEYYEFGEADYYFEANSDEEAGELARVECELRNAELAVNGVEEPLITAVARPAHLPCAADIINTINKELKND